MPRCFVIMPFSGTPNPRHDATYWDKLYHNFIKPAVEDVGYVCERSVASPGNIVGNIIGDLFGSNIVLAILTDFNPNVLYELGVRHSLAHGTIMALERGQTIPFDLANYGLVLYSDIDRDHFARELRNHIQKLHRQPGPDSPVAEHLRLKVGLSRTTLDVADSPLNTAGALDLAEEDILIIGQNLYGLATDKQEQDKVMSMLLQKTNLKIRIAYADSSNENQTKALAEIIDEAMIKQFPRVDLGFREWCAEWERRSPDGKNRLEIRRSIRVGNVSATMVDGRRSGGQILIRPVLYHTGSNTRPCIWIRSFNAPAGVFPAYQGALEQIWSHGVRVQSDYSVQ